MLKVKKLLEVASLENEETEAGTGGDDEFQIKEKKEDDGKNNSEKVDKSLLTRQDFKKIYLTPCEEAGEVSNEKKLILHRLILRFYLLEYLQNQQNLFGYFKWKFDKNNLILKYYIIE